MILKQLISFNDVVVSSRVLKGVGALQFNYNGTIYLVVGYYFDSASLIQVFESSEATNANKRVKTYDERKASRFLFLRFKELITRPDTIFWRILYLPSLDKAILGNALIAWRAFDVSPDQEDIERVFQAYIESSILPLIRIIPGTKKINPFFLTKVIIPRFTKEGSVTFFPRTHSLLKLYRSAKHVPISSALRFLRWIEPSPFLGEISVARRRLHASAFSKDDLEFPIFLIAYENHLRSILSLLPGKRIVFTNRPKYYQGTILTPGKNLSIDVFREFDSITIGKLLAITQGIYLDRFLPDFLQSYNAVRERFAEIGKSVNTIDFLTELEELSGLTITIGTQARVLSVLKPAVETGDAFFATDLDYLASIESRPYDLIVDLSALQIEERAFFTFSCLFQLSEVLSETKTIIVLDSVEEMILGVDRIYSSVNWLMDRILSLKLVVIRSNTSPWSIFPLPAKTYLVGGTTSRRLQDWIMDLLPQQSRDAVLSFLTNIPDSEVLKISEKDSWHPVLVELIPPKSRYQSLAPAVVNERSILPTEDRVELNIYADAMKMFSHHGLGLLDLENHIQIALGIKNAGIITTNLQRKKLITADFENPQITEKGRMLIFSDDELYEFFLIIKQQLNVSSIGVNAISPLPPAIRFWISVLLWIYLVRDHDTFEQSAEYAIRELHNLAHNVSFAEERFENGLIHKMPVPRNIHKKLDDPQTPQLHINWEIDPDLDQDFQKRVQDDPTIGSSLEFQVGSLPSSFDGELFVSRLISRILACSPEDRKSVVEIEKGILHTFYEFLGLESLNNMKQTFFSVACPFFPTEMCRYIEEVPIKVIQLFEALEESNTRHRITGIVSSLEDLFEPFKDLHLDYKDLLTIRSKLLLSTNRKD